jgi:hypothetical protein
VRGTCVYVSERAKKKCICKLSTSWLVASFLGEAERERRLDDSFSFTSESSEDSSIFQGRPLVPILV